MSIIFSSSTCYSIRFRSENKQVICNDLRNQYTIKILENYVNINLVYLSLVGSSGLVTGVALAIRAASAAAASSFLRLSSSSLSCSRLFNSFSSNCKKNNLIIFPKILGYVILFRKRNLVYAGFFYSFKIFKTIKVPRRKENEHGRLNTIILLKN